MKNVEAMIPKPKTSFVRIQCSSCGNTQVVFSSPSRKVKCLACEKNLLLPTGAKASFDAKVLQPVDRFSKEFFLTRADRRKIHAKKNRIEAVTENVEEAKENKTSSKEKSEQTMEVAEEEINE